ncbi:MAG: hypothetical protein GXP46_09560 [Deferribacteres bacterium]|nr:hypothetical protein [Deferribacteres bacterium]
MNTAAYIIINLTLFSSWYILLFRKKRLIGFADRVIGAFVLYLVQIVATEMLLGIIFRQLFAIPLFLLNISISLTVLVLALPHQRADVSFAAGNNIRSFLRSVLSEIKAETSRTAAIIRNDRILLFICGLFTLTVAWIVFTGYLFPPYAWDALWYHLPIAGYIMQDGAIREVSNHSFINQFINIFPKNMELFFIWNIIFLQNDVIVDLSQLPLAITGVLAVYSIAVKLGVRERYAIYSSLLFFFTPVIILQSTTNYVDVAVSALFIIAVNFLVHGNSGVMGLGGGRAELSGQKKIQTVLAGLATGILLGSKGSGPLFVIILSAAVLARNLYENPASAEVSPGRCRAIKKSFSNYAVCFLLPVLLMGAYWYAKNWVLYGNPVYPMEITIFNITLFKGLYSGMVESAPRVINQLSPLQRPLYVWLENIRYYLYDSKLGGLGPVWFILFLPSVVFSIAYAVIKKRKDYLAVCIVFAAAFLLYPRNWNPRYVIFIAGLGAVSFGLVMEYFHKRENLLRPIVLLLAGYVFLTANSPGITPEKVREFIHLPPAGRTIARQGPFIIDLYARQEYGYWTWISDNILKGDTLAYTFEPLFLSPLWNRAFSNRIAYVRSGDRNNWLRDLEYNNATYVLFRRYSQEDEWVAMEKQRASHAGLKERFTVVYADENYKIARFEAQ